MQQGARPRAATNSENMSAELWTRRCSGMLLPVLAASCVTGASADAATARQVPRLRWGTESVDEIVSALQGGQPIVLEGLALSRAAAGRWNLSHLAAAAAPGFQASVFVSSTSGGPRFGYYDPANDRGRFYSQQWPRPTETVEMSFAAFVTAAAGQRERAGGSERWHYLQQALVAGIGEELEAEYRGFAFDEAAAFKTVGGWGPMSSNLLLAAMPGRSVPPTPRTEQKQRAKNKEQRAKGKGHRAKGKGQREKSKEQRAKSRG